jgi:16S rRNA (cytidine1402-2'-O)-methyltransferase
LASVKQLIEVFGDDTEVAMGREMTKRFEQIFRGKAIDLLALLNSNSKHQKGEFVLAIQGMKISTENELNKDQMALATSLSQHLPPKVAAKIVAEHYQINKKQVYQYILESTKN